MNINEQLKQLGATDEWVAEDDNGDKWYVNYFDDGYCLTQLDSDVYISLPVCKFMQALPGLRLWKTREQYASEKAKGNA